MSMPAALLQRTAWQRLLAATQDLLGHASADTTRDCTRVASARQRALHRQAPR